VVPQGLSRAAVKPTGFKQLAASAVPASRVIIVKRLPGKGKGSYSAFYSDDFFSSVKSLFEGAIRVALTQSFVYVTKLDKERGVELFVSEGSKADYSFKKVELPFELLKEHAYTIAEVQSRHIYLHVSHSRNELYYGNLFVSDYYGRKFELSLKHNVRSPSGLVDFKRVDGVLGVYVANTYKEQSILSFEGRNKKGAVKALTNAEMEASIEQQTQITFDDGKTWNALKLRGEGCGPGNQECTLHLHSLSAHKLGLQCEASVPGVIIGHGNPGNRLSHEVASYISLDSGATWRLLMRGRRLYAVSQYAGIIVNVNESEPTTELLFSADYGASWSQMAFSREPVQVTRISVGGGAEGTKFVVTGIAGKEAGFAAEIGFARLFKRACNSEQEFDYEEWSLSELARK
jgi:hypothetical protein